MSGAAKPGDRVKVHYRGSLPDGRVFDTSTGSDPFEFIVGAGAVIPGFERTVIGMTRGELRTRLLDPSEAYGDYRQELVFTLSREEAAVTGRLAEGQVLEIRQPDGATHPVRVVSISEKAVTVDANHPLAGLALTFEITLVDIL